MKKVIDWIDAQIMSTEGYLADRREKLDTACRHARDLEGEIAEYERDMLGLKEARTRLEVSSHKDKK